MGLAKSGILSEVEFYKMIMLPYEDQPDYLLCDDFKWIENEFFVWIRHDRIEDFVDYFVTKFGKEYFDYKSTKADLTIDHVIINMTDLIGHAVDIESVFPKDPRTFNEKIDDHIMWG